MDSSLPVEQRGDPPGRQRARAEARGSFARVGGRTEPARLFETGGLRWRFPRSSSLCEAALVNTGGGVAGGDSYSVHLTLSEDAEVEATTPSAERIYRSNGPAASIATRLELRPGARLFWLPQETLLFEGARLERRLEVEASGDAEFLIAETLVFGRLAMGEQSVNASLRTRGACAATAISCLPTRRGLTTPARPWSARLSGGALALYRRSLLWRQISRLAYLICGRRSNLAARASRAAQAPSTD